MKCLLSPVKALSRISSGLSKSSPSASGTPSSQEPPADFLNEDAETHQETVRRLSEMCAPTAVPSHEATVNYEPAQSSRRRPSSTFRRVSTMEAPPIQGGPLSRVSRASAETLESHILHVGLQF